MSQLVAGRDPTRSADVRDPPSSSGPIVVGIGASAGGLDAAIRLMKAWTYDAHVAFILVQHSDPSAGSLMAALLAPHTAFVVLDAVDGRAIEPGHLYIVPPGRYLSTEAGVLHLSVPPARHAARMPFDFLLRSLAKRYGARAACVVLSGTGADGTAGLAAIRAAGGTVAVQDPAEAAYDGMPNSAIGTGMADFVLPIAEIPGAVSRSRASEAGARAQTAVPGAGPTPLPSVEPTAPAGDEPARGPGAQPTAAAGAAPTGGPDPEPPPVPRAGPGAAKTAGRRGGEAGDGRLAAILDLLGRDTDVDFTRYKPGTLQRRIARRAVLAGLRPDDLDAYLDLLRAERAELDALGRDLLIHVTRFFRDPAVFATLEASVMPGLVAAHPDDLPLRVWVAGCSSGEETYSLAMLLLERIEAGGRPLRLQVFASDVDPDAIATARDGTYPAAVAQTMPPARLARFFVREETGWRAGPELRAAIVFTIHDVLADPPFSRLDMVSCRNLLIYLRPEAQLRVLDAFHFALRDGGILLLGSAENAIAPEGRFAAVAKAERIYRRTDRSGAPAPLPLPRLALVRPGEERRPHSPPPPAVGIRPASLAELGRRLVLETVAPASVLVDAGNAVLFSLGPIDDYLRLPAGHATQDLLAMARPGLRVPLRTTLRTARDTGRKAVASAAITTDAARRAFDIVVHPVVEAGHDLLLVSFLEAPAHEPGAVAHAGGGDATRLVELQHELEATRAELQGAVRDLEMSGEEQRAINDEALSVNEEYQSTNEELVASKEELQSLNEELTAVNSQLGETLERQRTTSDDLQNVLYSTNVATLFLDLDGRIRFFTPAIKALFAIIAEDVGRRLASFATLAPDATLPADLDAVRRGQAAPDREIETAGGDWFRRRILPYRAGDGAVGGVVITYVDVTARKAAGRALEAARMEAEVANAAKGRFLAAASHDLRQPLQTLALLQTLLADAVAGRKAQDLVARQTITLRHMTGLLDTLLDINRIEAGVVQPAPSTFAIGGLMTRLGAEFAFQADAKGVRLRVVPCSLLVKSDEHLLEQMLRNLLSNAIRYTARGRVVLGCRRHATTLSLEVWDTGIGMADADVTRIFDEYVQIGNTARERGRGLGLGLGLSIVKRLGDLLGHAIRVRSAAGRGSVFAIGLPLMPAVAAEAAVAPPDVAARGRTLRILVVEDDPDIGEMLETLLLGAGHEVTSVRDGPSALARVACGTPDLVVADYNLPNGPNGLELATLIRAAVRAPLPVLILTGDISRGTTNAVARAGCSILIKPTTFPALGDAIARVLAPVARPVVFVVDDDDDVRGAIMAVVEDDGRAAVGFPSAEAFLQTFRDGDGDCLLIDAALPGMGGVDLLEQLRAGGHDLPAIVITGRSDVRMAIRAMKAGASDFIEKPVVGADLLASVVHALEASSDVAKLTARRDAAAARIAALTPRQREIMTLVLQGQPSKNIAVDLGISRRTVENHRASIMHRTGSASLPALARLALSAAAAV